MAPRRKKAKNVPESIEYGPLHLTGPSLTAGTSTPAPNVGASSPILMTTQWRWLVCPSVEQPIPVLHVVSQVSPGPSVMSMDP